MLFRKAVRSGNRNMDVRTAARTRYVCIGARVVVYASFAASLRKQAAAWADATTSKTMAQLCDSLPVVRQVLKAPQCWITQNPTTLRYIQE